MWQLTSGTDVFLITRDPVTGALSVSRPTIDALSIAASVAAGIGGTAGVAVSGAGAYARNDVTGSANAWIADSSVDASATVAAEGAVTLEAAASSSIVSTIVAASLAVGASGTAGIGVSIGVGIADNHIGGYASNGTRQPLEVRADLLRTSVKATGALLQTATSHQRISALVVAASAAIAGSGTVSIGASGAGAAAINTIVVDIAATITGVPNSKHTVRGIKAATVTLTASDDSAIKALAIGASMSVAIAGTAGIAASIAVTVAQNTIDNAVSAGISGVTGDVCAGGVTGSVCAGAVTIDAKSSSAIDSLAVAASLAAAGGIVGVSVSAAATVATNVILTHTTAFISGSSVTTTATGTTGDITVTASDTSSIKAVVAAVAAAVSGGVAAVGVAVGISIARNLIGWKLNGLTATTAAAEVSAIISDSVVSAAGDVTVRATSKASIDALVLAIAVAVAGGGAAIAGGGAGSEVENRIKVKVHAIISGTSTSRLTAQDVMIVAADEARIRALSIGAAATVAAGAAAVAVSIAVTIARNEVADEVIASLQNVPVVVALTLTITATSGAAPVVAEPGLSDAFLTQAAADTTDIAGQNGALVTDSQVATLRGALPSLGLSSHLAVITLVDNAEWVLRDVDAGRNWVIRKTDSGYDVSAATIDAVAIAAALALGAGPAGIAAAGGGALATNIVTSTVEASLVGGTSTVTGALEVTAEGRGAVLATIVSAALAVGAGFIGGGIAIGVAIARNIIGYDAGSGTTADRTLSAGTAQTVTTGQTVLVDQGPATGRVFRYVGAPTLTSLASVDFTDQSLWREVLTRNASEVQASIRGANVTAASILVTATSRQTISSIVVAAAVAVGAGMIGVGAAAAGSSAENRIAVDVAAYISGAGTVTATGALTVRATDTSTIKADVGAAALSAGVGLAGGALSIGVALAWNEIANAVEAYVQGATVKASSVTVTAQDTTTILAFTIAAAVAVGVGALAGASFAGAGALADNTIRSAVRAYGDGADITSTTTVEFRATGSATIRTLVLGLAAAVSVGLGVSIAASIGAAVARNRLGLDYDFTSTGSQLVRYGDRVLVTEGYGGGGTPGAVYRYIGSRALIALGGANYNNAASWVLEQPNRVEAFLHDTSVDAGGALTVRCR